MIAVHIEKVRSVCKHFSVELLDQHKKALIALELLLNGTTDRKDKLYVYLVYRLFRDNKDLIAATPDELKRFEKKIGVVPIEKYTSIPKDKKKQPKEKERNSQIWHEIVKALNYEGLRKTFYPKYFSLLGIKSCVYCNAQYTLSVEKEKGVYSAKFDVDHYRSKSNYPWQCISLFNLYPCCTSCNRVKNSSVIDFQLYSDDRSVVSKSGFRFSLSPLSKAKYLTTKDVEDIEINFEEPSSKSEHDKKFNIRAIYATQKDLAEQLIVSSQMYDDANRKLLSENFKKLKISPDVFNRVILGTYSAEKDIHRRPMSKFMQDIARDLGIL